MTLVVEDGTGKANAESLASVAAYKTHCDGRGITYGTDATIETQLRKGTDHLGQNYRTRLAGYRVSETQATDWPRNSVPRSDLGVPAYYPNDEVPAGIVQACIEASVRAGVAALDPDTSQAVKRKKVGPVEVEYQDFSRPGKTYPVIDNLMAPFLTAGGGYRQYRG